MTSNSITPRSEVPVDGAHWEHLGPEDFGQNVYPEFGEFDELLWIHQGTEDFAQNLDTQVTEDTQAEGYPPQCTEKTFHRPKLELTIPSTVMLEESEKNYPPCSSSPPDEGETPAPLQFEGIVHTLRSGYTYQVAEATPRRIGQTSSINHPHGSPPLQRKRNRLPGSKAAMHRSAKTALNPI